jgi:hypothetical protein
MICTLHCLFLVPRRSGQPYAISGGASGAFVYDAHGRRVKQTLDGETISPCRGLLRLQSIPRVE